MNESFLLNFMRAALDITQVERAFAVDTELGVLGTININLEEIDSGYLKCARQALEENKTIISDSYTIATGSADAPNTNHSIPQIRSVVFIPIQSQGAICLDQSVRNGVISKEAVDKLTHLAAYMVEQQQTDLDEAHMAALYNDSEVN